MSAAVLVFDELDEPECRRLLGTTRMGRLGFTENALPRILPVHYTVHGDDVVVVSLPGVKVAAAGRGDVVAFEIDDHDPVTGEAWCVGVVGPCRLVDDPAAVAALDELDFAPFTPDQDRRFIAIPTSVISGRRLHRVPAGRIRRAEVAAADGRRR